MGCVFKELALKELPEDERRLANAACVSGLKEELKEDVVDYITGNSLL